MIHELQNFKYPQLHKSVSFPTCAQSPPQAHLTIVLKRNSNFSQFAKIGLTIKDSIEEKEFFLSTGKLSRFFRLKWKGGRKISNEFCSMFINWAVKTEIDNENKKIFLPPPLFILKACRIGFRKWDGEYQMKRKDSTVWKMTK